MADIKIENLVVKFVTRKNQLVTAIDNLDLEIKDDSLNVIIGYSGCGKTTLLRTIAGLQKYEGNIYKNWCILLPIPCKPFPTSPLRLSTKKKLFATKKIL